MELLYLCISLQQKIKLYEIRLIKHIFYLQGYFNYIRSTLRTPQTNLKVIFIFYEMNFFIMNKHGQGNRKNS